MTSESVESQSGLPEQINFRDHQNIADPYPHFRELLAHNPVHWNRSLGGWCLTSYADVTTALKDPRFSANRIQPFVEHQGENASDAVRMLGDCLNLWMVFNDGEKHTHLRKLANKAFTRRAVAALKPRIAEIVDDQLDGFIGHNSFDFMADFSWLVPARVIAVMLGIPDEDLDELKRWSDDLASFVLASRIDPEKYERAAASLGEMNDYFARLIEHRRRNPGDQIIDGLINAHDGEELLSLPELIASCVLLLFAGHETTAHFFSNGLRALILHPDQMELFRLNKDDDPFVTNAGEELLRWDGPAISTVRVLTEDVSLSPNGNLFEMKKGERVFAFNGAANHDPVMFCDPGKLDLSRKNARRQISFGHGVHMCLGANLARLEGLIGFPRILSRMRGAEIDAPAPEWLDTLLTRGVKHLQIKADVIRA
jgi:cytochrome P450